MVARLAVRHWFGHTTTVVESVTEDRDNAVTARRAAAPRGSVLR